ncbi:hypothetical protein J2S02_003263 [Metabacillus niabensis]|uniref:Uncharacterized protein n=1 Tax=Metabacillus niabensis TaxID=324854 RepID=A0ABT9Z3T6_9BACI|nr:hypothetical protein [Metabacillus niabensis]
MIMINIMISGIYKNPYRYDKGFYCLVEKM